MRKENLFLKKAAAFFAKEIDERLIDFWINIMRNLESAGCSDGSAYVQTLITTTADTGRRIIIPKIRGSGTDQGNLSQPQWG